MLCLVKEIPDVATIHCMIDDQPKSWIAETVYAFFDQETADQIMQLQISKEGEDFVR
jgi:hypothetical protein